MQTTESRLTSGTEHEIDIIRDFLTAEGGVLASCSCTWQGPIRDKRHEAQQDATTHQNEIQLATPEQFADRLARLKTRNGNDQPHPDAGNPYEQIPASDLRVGDVFASGIAVTEVDPIEDSDGLIVYVGLADGSAFRYGDTNLVLIKRRPTEHVEAHQLRAGDVIVGNDGETIPVLQVTPDHGLVFIWTTTTGGFAMSANVTTEIARRNGGA